jgi:hypothetical protein
MSLPSTPLIVVLDSSVLHARWSRLILQSIAARRDPPFLPFWSEWIIAETWRTLASLWLDRVARSRELEGSSLTRAANDMLRHLLVVMRLVSIREYSGPGAWPGLTDVDDEPIWQTADVAGARYVVSQNIRHFPPLVHGRHVYRDIEYLTAVELIEDVLGESAAAAHTGPLPRGATLRSGRER